MLVSCGVTAPQIHLTIGRRSFSRAARVGEGGAKRRMRAGARQRDGGASGKAR
jgi:hypothetical protein